MADASKRAYQLHSGAVDDGTLQISSFHGVERMSALFKTLHVVRAVDAKRNTLVYLTYSDRVVSGSPKNSVTAVPLPTGVPIPMER